MADMPFVVFQSVSKVYGTGDAAVRALNEVSFEIERGGICVIVGQSGAGKTTLLNILGGMDRSTSGHVFLDGVDISGFSKRQLASYRRSEIGFVFQFYNLIQNLTARENVEIATQMSKDPIPPDVILRDVGLADRMTNFPSQLSGGEQQRVAIARALAKRPKLLLCDEPTGALDYQTGKAILKLLQDQSRESGMTVVIITHNQALTQMADRVIKLKSSTVISSSLNPSPVPVEELEW